MNTTLDILFNFVRKNYKEILEEDFIDSLYKDFNANFLSKNRRKITAFLKYIGERNFRGCVYEKNKIRITTKNKRSFKNKNLRKNINK